MQKVCKKVFRMFGGYVKKLYLCTRNRERDAAVIEILKVKLGSSNHSKKLFEKFLRKSLVVRNKVLTFASAFETKAIKKSSLKDLDMNKQVVQFLLK